MEPTVVDLEPNNRLLPTKASIKRKPTKLRAIKPNTNHAALSLIC